MKRLLMAIIVLLLTLCATFAVATSSTIDLPDSVTVIESEAFCGIAATQIVLPDGLERIESRAFANSWFWNMTIPETVNYIADDAFDSVPDYATIYVHNGSYAEKYFSTAEVSCKVSPLSPYTPWDALIHEKQMGENGWIITVSGYDTSYHLPDNNVFLALSDNYYGEPIEAIDIPNRLSNKAYLPVGTLYLPDCVRTIGDYAFDAAQITGEVHIPASVTTIGEGAFQLCGSITAIHLPNSVQSIEKNAFYGCSSLACITLPSSITNIGDQAFSNCNSLTTVTLPASDYTMGYSVFSDCRNISTVNVPEGATTIGSTAFYNCTGITGELVLPSSLSNMGYNAFAGCTGITSLTLTEGLSSIAECAFQNCTGLTGELILPSSLSNMGYNAFAGCTGITSLTLAEGVGHPIIGDYAFSGCTGIKSLTLTEGLSAIGHYAFENCSGLTGELIIPASLNSMGTNCFAGCAGITSIKLTEGLTTLGDYAFYGCTGLIGEQVIPSSLNNMGTHVFAECTNLTSVYLTPGLTDLGDYAFYGCTGLTGTITFPESMTNLGDFSFAECAGLNDYTFPSSLTQIPNGLFENCTGLSGILRLPRNLKSIGYSAFSNCKFSGNLVLPGSLKEIGSSAFENCSGLTGALNLKNVEDIGVEAFKNCTGFYGDLVMSAYVDADAFRGCAGFTSVTNYCCSFGLGGMTNIRTATIYGTPTSIPAYAFEDCTNLLFINADFSKVRYIREHAFANCINLVSIPPLSSEYYLETGAFMNCESLSGIIKISGGVEFMEGIEDAFVNCRSLSGLYVCGKVWYLGKHNFEGVSDNFTIYGNNSYAKSFAEGKDFNYCPYDIYPESTISLYASSGLPRGNHYRGNEIDLRVWFKGSEGFDTVTLSIIDAKGQVAQQASATFPDRACSLEWLIGRNLKTSQLELGTYRIVLTATIGESDITLAVSEFTVVHPPFSGTISGIGDLTCGVLKPDFKFTGTLTGNTALTSVQATLQDMTAQGAVQTFALSAQNEKFAFASLNDVIDISTLIPLHKYRFTLSIDTAREKGVGIINTYFVVSESGKVYTRKELEAISAFVSDMDNYLIFNKYNDGLIYIGNLDFGDGANMVFQSILNPLPLIQDLFDTEGNGRAIIKCYEEQLLSVLKDVDPSLDLVEDVEAPWYLEAVEDLNQYGKITFTTVKDLAGFDKYFEGFSNAISELFTLMETSCTAEDLGQMLHKDLMSILRDYENSLRILNIYASSDEYNNNPDYRRAVDNLIMAFNEQAIDAVMECIEYLCEQGVNEIMGMGTELLMFLISGTEGSAAYSIVTWSLKEISTLFGWDVAAEGTVELITQQNIFSNAIDQYQELFLAAANGDTSTETLSQMELWFRTARSSGVHVYEILHKLKSNEESALPSYTPELQELVSLMGELDALIYKSPYQR